MRNTTLRNKQLKQKQDRRWHISVTFCCRKRKCFSFSFLVKLWWVPPVGPIVLNVLAATIASSVASTTTSTSRLGTSPVVHSLTSILMKPATETSVYLPTSTSAHPIDAKPSALFAPQECSDSNFIGISCNTSSSFCNFLQPCLNAGSCTSTPHLSRGYTCVCAPGFTGANCEQDIRLCKPNMCWHDGMLLIDETIAMRCVFVEGRCIEINRTDFFCNCTRGHTGLLCEGSDGYCQEVTCYNRGVCVSSLVDYTCQCISTSYSGRHCENVAGSIVLRQYVSRTLGYIAIIAIVLVAAFVLMMDLLKYGFGIDPVGEERERNRHRKAKVLKRQTLSRRVQRTMLWLFIVYFFSLRRGCHVIPMLFRINTLSKVVVDLLFPFADVANLLGTHSTSRWYYSFHTWIGVLFYSLTRSRLVVKTYRSLITVLWPVDRRELLPWIE